jgi:ribosome production factor 2
MFSKRNDIHPFIDAKPLEFFSLKNDASLLVFGSHSKKKPHNLVITRTFDYQMLDMIELGITDLRTMEEISGKGVQQGMRPLIIFNGDQWEAKQEYETMRSIFLDLYTGDFETDKIDLKGLSHLMVFTLDSSSPKTKVKMGVYNIVLKKSGGKTPLVELEEMGPFVNFELRRYTLANEDMLKQAMKAPKLDKVFCYLCSQRHKRIFQEMSLVKRLVKSGWILKIWARCRPER